MVEGGSLENCFSGIPANEGSNPSSSAICIVRLPATGAFSLPGLFRGIRTDEVKFR